MKDYKIPVDPIDDTDSQTRLESERSLIDLVGTPTGIPQYDLFNTFFSLANLYRSVIYRSFQDLGLIGEGFCRLGPCEHTELFQTNPDLWHKLNELWEQLEYINDMCEKGNKANHAYLQMVLESIENTQDADLSVQTIYVGGQNTLTESDDDLY